MIAWTLAPKAVLPEILSFLLTMFTVLLLPGLWILWAAPDVDGGDWLKRIPLAFTLSYALWSIPIFVIMRLHATWEAFYVLFFSFSLLIPLLAVILSRRKTIEGIRLRESLAPGRIMR